METNTCLILTGICMPDEAWAAWAQAILTVATVWYSLRYQKSFNDLLLLQAEADRLQAEKDKITKETEDLKAQQQRAIHAILIIRSKMLRLHSNLQEAVEGEYDSPLAKWHAIRVAFASADTFDLGYDVSKFGVAAPILLGYANTLESTKYSPIGKRNALNNADASKALSETSTDLMQLLMRMEQTLIGSNTLIEEMASDGRKSLKDAD